jgi:hypothetical protein
MHVNARLLHVFIPFGVEGTRRLCLMERATQLNVQIQSRKGQVRQQYVC